MITSLETCWCGGKKAGETKHRRAGESACPDSIADRRAYDKTRTKKARRWTTGSPILLDEEDPL